MDFEWDQAKSDHCLEERGFDFAFAALIFEGDTIEWTDRRRDYGETRITALGRSARRANKGEANAYRATFGF